MTRYVGAAEAARQLGVKRATLYAYVSRGQLDRRIAVDGRTSLYSVDELDAHAARTRSREPAARPTLDVQIATGVTTLDEDSVRYRGHDVARLACMCSFEQVAELLWSGDVPTRKRASWDEPAAADVALTRRAAGASGSTSLGALVAVTNALGSRHPGDAPDVAARRLLSCLPYALAGRTAIVPTDGSGRHLGVADLLAQAWLPRRPGPLAPTLDRTLVLLADHELATSTIAVRLAGSVRAAPYAAFVAGLGVLAGPLHGGASARVVDLLVECERHGAEAAIAGRLGANGGIDGFGHKIYVGDDPRLAPLLDAIALLPDPHGRRETVTDLLTTAGARVVRRPNVDLGLGALLYVAGLPADTPVFATARLAGFAAHLAEELDERPLRFRGIARP